MVWQNPTLRSRQALAHVAAGGFLVIAMSTAWYGWPSGRWLGSGPVAAFGAFVVALVLSDTWKRQELPPKPGLCPTCGYDLAGLPGDVCPECGIDVEAEP